VRAPVISTLRDRGGDGPRQCAGAVLLDCLPRREALLIAGSDAQKKKWLPAIASGEAIGTLALFEGKGNPSPKNVKLTAANGVLNGVKKPVADGAIANFAVVAAAHGIGGRDSDISLFLVDLRAGGVEVKTSPISIRPVVKPRSPLKTPRSNHWAPPVTG